MGRLVALLASAGVLLMLVTVLRPGALLGSAPRTPDWGALPAEVRVVDGETLRLGDRVLRLYGLEAPARGQACGAVADCGGMAAAELARLVRDRSVECRIQGQDRMGRALGTCRAGGVEINGSLVMAGWARADAALQPALVPLEQTARAAGRGMWAPH